MWICHRNPSKMSEMRKTVDGVTELQEQLQELYEEVNRMIEEGDEDTARALIEANYESLMEQFEPGVYCVEQAAMLDVLAQLRMSLGDFVEVEDLLIQVCNHSSACNGTCSSY
jgi:predicted transcriptional regulator